MSSEGGQSDEEMRPGRNESWRKVRRVRRGEERGRGVEGGSKLRRRMREERKGVVSGQTSIDNSQLRIQNQKSHLIKKLKEPT